ncbi:DUF2628 domain-containing protein [Rhodoferax sp.]|uniref:DUF2628 domain-containing protein n=1 Tax=Rhodoferax sp. TaxID=50421 RepID=UPI00274C61F7|nr:DUF2628 domain-containing protein [Rhodoferax sp.]
MTSASNHPTSAISDSWKKKFALMDQIKKSPESSSKLPLMTRLGVNYNLLAFLLGPIYYFVKGMWKRAITLTAIAFVVVMFFVMILAETARNEFFMSMIGPVIFMARANGDYYKKMVQGNNGWW